MDAYKQFIHDVVKDLGCPICLSIMTEPSRLPCCHYFCGPCLARVFISDKGPCPMCNKLYRRRDITRDKKMADLVASYNKYEPGLAAAEAEASSPSTSQEVTEPPAVPQPKGRKAAAASGSDSAAARAAAASNCKGASVAAATTAAAAATACLPAPLRSSTRSRGAGAVQALASGANPAAHMFKKPRSALVGGRGPGRARGSDAEEADEAEAGGHCDATREVEAAGPSSGDAEAAGKTRTAGRRLHASRVPGPRPDDGAAGGMGSGEGGAAGGRSRTRGAGAGGRERRAVQQQADAGGPEASGAVDEGRLSGDVQEEKEEEEEEKQQQRRQRPRKGRCAEAEEEARGEQAGRAPAEADDRALARDRKGGRRSSSGGQAASERAAAGASAAPASPPVVPGDGGPPAPSPAAGTAERRIPTRLLPWACRNCTLINKSAAKRCSLCRSGRDDEAAAPTPELPRADAAATPTPAVAAGGRGGKRRRSCLPTPATSLALADAGPAPRTAPPQGNKRSHTAAAVPPPSRTPSARPPGPPATHAAEQEQAEPRSGAKPTPRAGPTSLVTPLAPPSRLSAWLTPGSSHWSLVSSGLEQSDKSLLKRLSQVSGARLLDKWPSAVGEAAVTHVVCRTDENRCARRTIKYLMGLVCGCWVVDVGWVKECLDKAGAVAERPFEVVGDQAGGQGGARVSRERGEEGLPPLLQGWRVSMAGPFASREELTGLLRAAGAVLLDAGWSAKKQLRPRQRAGEEGGGAEAEEAGAAGAEAVVVLVDVDSAAEVPARRRSGAGSAQQVMPPPGSTVVSHKWLLDSLGSMSILPTRQYESLV